MPGAITVSRTGSLLLAISSGVALALAFPTYNLSLLAWIAPAALIVASVNSTPRLALRLGWLQGAVFYSISVPWIYTVMRQYGPLSPVEAGGVLALLVVAAGAFHAIFSLCVAWLARSGKAKSGSSLAYLAAPFLWTSLEFCILHLPDIGFPWNLLGYGISGNLAFVQITAVTGIFGLSFLVAAYNSLIAWLFERYRVSGKLSGAGIGISATAVLVVIGLAGPQFVPRAQADHVAHLVQTNLPQSLRYPSNWMEVHAPELDELEKTSVVAAQRLPGLVVWPEVPAPFSLQDARFLVRARRVSAGVGNGFLFGVVDWKPLTAADAGATNSAAMLDSAGSLKFMYDKIHLVPFGEYVPWRNVLTFAGKLTADIGDFQRGREYKVGQLPGGSFSVLICYEAIFPNEVRRFTAAGANVLINISNDGWFGGSSAPAQHLAMARVRAVENRRWLLRDTNTGITASVDPYGRIVAQSPTGVRNQLDAPYGFRTDRTLYVRWGDWLPWLCVAVSVVLLLLGVGKAFAR